MPYVVTFLARGMKARPRGESRKATLDLKPLATIISVSFLLLGACTGPQITNGPSSTHPPQITVAPTRSTSSTTSAAPAGHGPPLLFGKSVPGGGDEIFLAYWDGTIGENLTMSPAGDHRGEISPDGKIMVFGSDRDGPTNLYLMDLASHEVTRLTSNPANDWGPVWAPDGSRIAFYRAGPGLVPTVYVVELLGSEETAVTDGVVPANAVDWSSDGEWLFVWMAPEGSFDIYRIRPNGTDLDQITDSPGSEGPGAVSPDGTLIAFSYAGPGGSRDIWVMGVDGSGRRQLTDDPAEDWTTEPVWSPDGSLVIYQAGVRGDYYTVGIEGSAPRKIFDAP